MPGSAVRVSGLPAAQLHTLTFAGRTLAKGPHACLDFGEHLVDRQLVDGGRDSSGWLRSQRLGAPATRWSLEELTGPRQQVVVRREAGQTVSRTLLELDEGHVTSSAARALIWMAGVTIRALRQGAFRTLPGKAVNVGCETASGHRFAPKFAG